MIVDALALLLNEFGRDQGSAQDGRTQVGRSATMKATKYVYWQDEDMWLGYLEHSPDYWTQGETREELENNLKDILAAEAGEQI